MNGRKKISWKWLKLIIKEDEIFGENGLKKATQIRKERRKTKNNVTISSNVYWCSFINIFFFFVILVVQWKSLCVNKNRFHSFIFLFILFLQKQQNIFKRQIRKGFRVSRKCKHSTSLFTLFVIFILVCKLSKVKFFTLFYLFIFFFTFH